MHLVKWGRRMTTGRQSSRHEDVPPQTQGIVNWDRNGLYTLVDVPDPSQPGRCTEQRLPVKSPCADDPRLFDLELSSDRESVDEALRICSQCPFLTQCREWRTWYYANECHTNGKQGNGAQLIWAGEVIDSSNQVLPPDEYEPKLRKWAKRRETDRRKFLEEELPAIEQRLAELVAATASPDGPSLGDARPGRRRNAEDRRNDTAA